MTLNASGPISLGGSTVGQSVNLELGQSATAVASINATNFRTLAGVASGQISLSNFYGKSSATGYIIYLNTTYTNSTSDVNWSAGWQVNNQGMSMFAFGGGSGQGKVTWISNTGTTLATTNITQNYAANFVATQNLFPSNNDTFVMTYGAGFCTTAWSPSSSYLTPTVPNIYSGYADTISVIGMPDGSVVTNGYSDEGKYGFKAKFTKVSGSSVLNFTWAGPNYISSNSWAKMLRYTDGTFIQLWKYGNDIYFNKLYSDLTADSSSVAVRLQSVSYGFGAEVDSNNNLYVLGNQEGVYKISSSLSSGTRYIYSAVNWACAYRTGIYARNAFGMGIYNDILYIASNAGDAVDAASANPGTLTVCAITCSTMNVLWTKRFVFNSTWIYFTPFTNTTRGGGGIQVRPTGVYISFMLSNQSGGGTSGYALTMCLPLDGNVANQTVTVNDNATPPGANIGTMTITSPTNTRTTGTYSILSNSPSNIANASGASFATTVRVSASGITSATPKTAF